MPPFFTPTTIVYKILFFLKRFLVAAADNVPPHKLSSLSYPPSPPLQSVKQDLWQSARRANSCVSGYRWGAFRSLPTCSPVNWSILTDMDGNQKGGREGRVNEQMSGLVGGCWGRGCGKCFHSGVSPDRVR